MTELKVLICSEQDDNSILEQRLQQCGHKSTCLGLHPLDLESIVNNIKPDILILDVFKPTDHVLQMLVKLNQFYALPVIMFAEEPGKETVDKIIKAGVCAYVVANIETKRIGLIVEIAVARFKDRQALQQELEKTKTKLEERKIVEKAKGILSSSQCISEEQAYHTLRKLAMERSIPIAEMAHNVISMASLLETKR